MQAPVLNRIRDEIWLKLWGNVCLNPISALTHATLDVICSNPATRALSKAIMVESQTIAENSVSSSYGAYPSRQKFAGHSNISPSTRLLQLRPATITGQIARISWIVAILIASFAYILGNPG